MTTTKVKTRKSDQLSLPGPEELFLYNSAKNIWMEGKALYFPGTTNTGQFTRKLWSIFLIQAKMVKSLNISCQQTQTLHRRPDELHRLKPFPPKRKRTNAHQVLGKLPKKRVLFFVILRCSIVFFPDKMVDRDQYVFIRWKLPCQCIYGFLLNICLLWFNFILGLDFITLFWGIEMYNNEFKTEGN